MKRFLSHAVLGLLLAIGTMTITCATASAEEAMNMEDGRVYSKCPRCGEPILFAHEHVEEEEGLPISFGMDNTFLSKYVWRGLNVTDDPVWQPAVWFSYKNLTLNVWGNMDLTDVNGNEGEFNELDFTVDYSWNWDKFHFSTGAIRYEFPNTAFTGTTEVYAGMGYDVLLQPSLTVYYDFDEADGFYGNLAIGHSFEIPKFTELVSTSLELSAQLGFASKNWNNFYYGEDSAAFVDFLVSASLPVAIGDHVTVSPTVSYSTVVDKDLRAGGADNHNFVWGATLSVSF